jgi:hypothetical protein
MINKKGISKTSRRVIRTKPQAQFKKERYTSKTVKPPPGFMYFSPSASRLLLEAGSK